MGLPEDFPIKNRIIDHGEIGGVAWVTAGAPIYSAANGYIRLPSGHPWLEMEGYNIPTEVPWGEITYGSGNWIGFDSLHSGQYWPEQGGGRSTYDTEMTHEMVIEWTKQLAQEAVEYVANGIYSI